MTESHNTIDPYRRGTGVGPSRTNLPLDGRQEAGCRGTRHLVEPRLFHDPERRSVPPIVRRVLGWLDSDAFFELRIVPASAMARSPQASEQRAPGHTSDL